MGKNKGRCGELLCLALAPAEWKATGIIRKRGAIDERVILTELALLGAFELSVLIMVKLFDRNNL
jgi:hypothetical protein